MTFKRFNKFNHDVVVVDGVFGCGKSLITPIISSLAGIEKQQYDPIFEYLCILNWLNKIDKKTCEELISQYADLNHYNSLIGRDINTKNGDDTGIFNNPKALTYIKRILFKNNNEIDISDRLALQLFTHNTLAISSPLFNALGSRLKFIEMMRHPLYVIKHWFVAFERLYLPTHSQFEFCLDISGFQIPWFARDYAEEFEIINNVEKSILSIEKIYSQIDNHDNHNYLLLNFESFSLSPSIELDKLCSFLGRDKPKNIDKILRRQKLPRDSVSQGKGQLKYGFKSNTGLTEKEIYASHWKFVKDNCSPEYCQKLLTLIEWYDEKFPSALSKFK